MSEGFVRAGFIPVAHVESNKAACLTLTTRVAYHWLKERQQLDIYHDYLRAKIGRKALYALLPPEQRESVIHAEISPGNLETIFNRISGLLKGAELDLIIGGPPCQAYSVVGRSRDKNGMVGDQRNYLYKLYAEFLDCFKPKYFVFENVTGLLSAKDKDGSRYYDNMISLFDKIGYWTERRVLTASDYGVLQQRRRVILVGNRDRKRGFFPEPQSWKPGVLVRELLQDLPAIKAGEGSILPLPLSEYSGTYLRDAGIRTTEDTVTLHAARPHIPRDLEIYRIAVERWNTSRTRLEYTSLPADLKTHANQTDFGDRYKVVAGDLPVSQTVVAHIAKDGHYYIHPDIAQNHRSARTASARASFGPTRLRRVPRSLVTGSCTGASTDRWAGGYRHEPRHLGKH